MLFMGIIYRHTWACYHDMVLLYIHICTVYTRTRKAPVTRKRGREVEVEVEVEVGRDLRPSRRTRAAQLTRSCTTMT